MVGLIFEEPVAIRRTAHENDLLCRKREFHAQALRHESKSLCELAARPCLHFAALKKALSEVFKPQTSHDAQQCRLTSPVWSDEGNKFGRLKCQVGYVQHNAGVIAHACRPEFEQKAQKPASGCNMRANSRAA